MSQLGRGLPGSASYTFCLYSLGQVVLYLLDKPRIEFLLFLIGKSPTSDNQVERRVAGVHLVMNRTRSKQTAVCIAHMRHGSTLPTNFHYSEGGATSLLAGRIRGDSGARRRPQSAT